jgi:hypothetical protein
MLTSTATVRAGDFTGDGRSISSSVAADAGKVSLSHESYLLRNDGGHFTDVTEAVAPEAVHPGE